MKKFVFLLGALFAFPLIWFPVARVQEDITSHVQLELISIVPSKHQVASFQAFIRQANSHQDLFVQATQEAPTNPDLTPSGTPTMTSQPSQTLIPTLTATSTPSVFESVIKSQTTPILLAALALTFFILIVFFTLQSEN